MPCRFMEYPSITWQAIVFSISAFPDKPFVTTDLKELRSESIYIRRNAASYFQMNSQTKSSHPSNCASRIVIYDVERTETASQRYRLWSDHYNQCINKNAQVSICRRLGSWCGGRMIRAWRQYGHLVSQLSIWPCGLTRMDVDTLRLPRILCNSGFLATNMLPWTK
jgi:hypothetical protein